MKSYGLRVAVAALVVWCCSGVSAEDYEEWDGCRSRAVHILPLYDEFGAKISPNDTRPMPFSARQTCGECHDYEAISSGWHFNSHDPDVPSGKPA